VRVRRGGVRGEGAAADDDLSTGLKG